jgi:hypothetical protein
MGVLNFYVYVLFDWLGIPRYVGKGRGDRWMNHEQRSDRVNWMKNEFIERTWIMFGEIPKVRIQESLSERDALYIETCLIKAIGRIDLRTGPLTNLTDGGDGCVELRPEARARQHRFKPGQTYSPERNAKISAAMKGRERSSEHSRNISLAKKGKPRSPAAIEKGRISATGKKQSEETKAKKSATQKGRKFTPEHLANLRAALANRPSRTGIPMPEETKAKLSALQTHNWASGSRERLPQGPDGRFVQK